jgi:hypothetical protein
MVSNSSGITSVYFCGGSEGLNILSKEPKVGETLTFTGIKIFGAFVQTPLYRGCYDIGRKKLNLLGERAELFL